MLVAPTAALLTIAYLVPFRSYGLNVEDEGTLLYQLQRVLRGEIPYVDFATGYTPGFFYLGAALWRLAWDLSSFRVLLALLHGVTAAGLALLVARAACHGDGDAGNRNSVVGAVLAVLVPLLYVVWIPVFPGEFCAFSVPYPAWFATLAWIAMALALLGFLARLRRGWLVLAGLGAAAALAFKPNAGTFAIAAATAVVLLVEEPSGRRGGIASATLWIALWAGVVGGAWVALGGIAVAPRDAAVYLLPLVAAMAALVTRSRVRRAYLVGDVACLLGAFALATLPWLALLHARLGTEAFLREVLLLGSDAARIYYTPYPAFETWALVVTALLGAFALAGALVRRQWLRPGIVAGALLAGVIVAGAAVVRVGVMPERLLWSVIWQLESAGFPLTLATQAAGVVWLWRQRRSRAAEVPAALLLCGLYMHLQLYPRADFMHLLGAAPLTVVFAAFLLALVLRWWREGLAAAGAPRWWSGAGVGLVALGAGVIALRAAPNLMALTAVPRDELPVSTAAVGVERARAADVHSLGEATLRLAQLVPRGEASLAFPALDVMLFLTGARSPTPYAYFFPGRPDHREEAEVVDALAARPPAGLATANRGFTFFDAAPAYYFLLRRFVRQHYVLSLRSGRYDVLALAERTRPTSATSPRGAEGTGEPRGELERRLAEVEALAGRPPAQSATPLLAAATSDDAVLRRAGLLALTSAIARDEPSRGLEDYVADAGLDRRREVLLLRTIRDTRDARAASYLFATAASADPRIAGEALEAMYRTRAELIARRHLWAGPEEPEVWPARGRLQAVARATLADPEAPPRAAAFAAHVAGALGDLEAVPALRARLADPVGATSASAADAVARLAPMGLACSLTVMLGRPDPEIAELVPSALLQLAESAEPVRAEARACLLAAAATPGAAEEPAIWILASLADAQPVPVLIETLSAPSAAIRRAAAWALGETPPGPEAALALSAVAAADVDAVVRRLAAQAAAKQAGTVPRALLDEPAAG